MAKKQSSRKKATVRSTDKTPLAGFSLSRFIFRILLGVVILASMFLLSRPGVFEHLSQTFVTRIESRGGADTHGGILRGDAELATLFTPEVLFWEEDIKRWGEQRKLNPNLIATIMQIESCGHPYVSSHAGAQGLFQVMPLHFENGENQLNPETNAQSGLDHLVDCLVWTDYDVGVSFACYNGGPSVIGLPQSQWFQESRSYYRWGTGIFEEASQGKSQSETLTEWLAAGGSILCGSARETQANILPHIVSKSSVD